MNKVEFEKLCMSANGKYIQFDLNHSHTSTHFHDTPELRNAVIKLLESIAIDGETIGRDYDIGNIVGVSDVVDTDETDEIVYAIRTLREDQGYVPFTKSRTPEPTRFISVYLSQIDEQTYDLKSAWFGRYEMPPFPQMPNATKESIPYWSTHAFVWGSQSIIAGSETHNPPWSQ